MAEKDDADFLQLEGRTAEGSRWVIPINLSPFLVGRKAECHLRLGVDGVSRMHARIYREGGGWWIADCGSTNGTFVDHLRLTEPRALRQGSSVRFADVQFTVAAQETMGDRTQITNPHASAFERMLRERAVTPHFQPIVRLSAGHDIFGYELLGHTDAVGLPGQPGELFQIARRLGSDVELSVLFREVGLSAAAESGLTGVFFFNVLPAEMNVETLGRTLSPLRCRFPDLKLALELHEQVIADAAMMRALKQMLTEMNILLSYDDFGAGQARLVELMESPPDVIKFDIALVHGIELRSRASRAIVGALVRMAQEAGITTLAEGIETAAEADACMALGFDLAQGFHFGRPQPLARYASPMSGH